MPRNEERDRREAEQRKSQLIEAGFELFSRHGIESVSLSAVAERAGVPASTMYKYFQNKVNLSVAISGRIWSDVWQTALGASGAAALANMDPCQLFETYADVIISLYRSRPQVLRYSGNYKTFIRRENVPQDALGEHLDPLKPMEQLFVASCRAAAGTGALRADIDAGELYSFVALTMLTMAERYAQGIVWTDAPAADHAADLVRLKGMLSAWMKGEC